MSVKIAELAELVDALDSGSSVCKDFRVQVPGSAFKFWSSQVKGEIYIYIFLIYLAVIQTVVDD